MVSAERRSGCELGDGGCQWDAVFGVDGGEEGGGVVTGSCLRGAEGSKAGWMGVGVLGIVDPSAVSESDSE